MKRPPHAWVVRLQGEVKWAGEECLAKDVMAIGWKEVLPLSQFSSKDELREALRGVHPEWSDKYRSWVASQLWRFAQQMETGDWVISPLGGKSVAVGTVASSYEHNPEVVGEDAPHILRVKWSKRGIKMGELSEAARHDLQSADTLRTFDEHLDELCRLLGLPEEDEGEPGSAPPVGGEFKLDKIEQMVRDAHEKWGRAKRRPKEENTRTHLIVPILEALGWDRYDIYCEFDVEEGGKVDVALFLSGKPVVFVEAKSFDTDFAPDGNEVKQALDYAYKQGVAWAILTNGRQWWVYDAFAKVPHQEKRILAVDLLQQGRQTRSSCRPAQGDVFADSQRCRERRIGTLWAARPLLSVSQSHIGERAR